MQKFLLAIAFACLLPLPAGAFYTNDSFALDVEHVAPATFTADGAGGFYGTTVDSRAFTQKPVANDLGIKLHKFTIDDAFFYIGQNGAFKAENDLAALSIYLANQ